LTWTPPVSGDCTAPTDARRLNPPSPYSITDMEESGEYCTVVFAQIVTEPARRGMGEAITNKHTHVYDSVKTNAKTTVQCHVHILYGGVFPEANYLGIESRLWPRVVVPARQPM
jgi:hypothetical protein